ncbi:lysyl-tRNA synthetase, class 2 [Paenibacillaceae bacterium GAS479]|nr:lysyl-tRNA synthetase, class 2 [Paenibacillaceae bacterium GAS479]
MKIFMGRIINIRKHKKWKFLDVIINAKKVQFLFRNELMDNNFIYGDIVEIHATSHTNNNGDLIYKASKCEIICRPEKIFKNNKKIDYKNQYLCALTGQHMINIIKVRSIVLFAIRKFFNSNEFVEIETPILQTSIGTSSSNPVVTNKLRNNKKYYLKRSGELQQKQIIMTTMSDVYEISKVFRDQGQTRTTMVEYNMLDFYKVGANYLEAMSLTEQLLRAVIEEAREYLTIENIDSSKPFERKNLLSEVGAILGQDLKKPLDSEKTEKVLLKYDMQLGKAMDKADIIEFVFNRIIKPKIKEPVFYFDFPQKFCPLGKPKDDFCSEEFKLIINGISIGHGYTELIDKELQFNFLKDQFAMRLREGRDAEFEKSFLESMSYGFPPMTGVGIGIDRLIAVLLGQSNIRKTKIFPFY